MDVLTMLREAVGALLALAGLVLIFGGSLGLLRFPDVFTRVHAAMVSDGAGTALTLAGLAVMAPDAALALRLGLLAVLVAVLSPLLAHLTAAGAHAGGVAPIAGAYRAPRSQAEKRSAP